jgi:hypothetical protein
MKKENHKKNNLFMLHISLCILILILISSISFANNSPTLVSPKNNTITTNNSLSIKFNPINDNGSYTAIFSNDAQMNNIIKTIDSNESSFNLSNLITGKYYFRIVDKTLENNWLYSEVYQFSIVKKPSDFFITINLDDYHTNQFAHLFINAEINSSIKLKITGPSGPIEYNPNKLQNPNWYAKLESAGTHTITALMEYYDYYDEFSTSFEIPHGEVSTNSLGDDTTIQNNSSKLINISLKILDSAINNYPPMQNVTVLIKLPNGTTTTKRSNTGGIISLNKTKKGKYTFFITKKNYSTENLKFDINEDFSLDILLKNEVINAGSSTISASRLNSEIVLTNPSNNSYFTESEKYIDIDYTIKPFKNLTCQLFFKEKSNLGWSIINEYEKSKFNINISPNKYRLINLEQGSYSFMIKCQDQKLIQSETITFHVKRPTLDIENIGISEKLVIKNLKTQIKGFNSDILLALETLKIISSIENLNSQIDQYNREIREKTKELDDLSKIESIVDDYNKKLSALSTELPLSIEITDESTLIKYLPGDGFSNMLTNLKKSNNDFITDKLTDKNSLEDFQKNYYQNIKIKKIEIAYKENKKEFYTFIKKEVQPFNSDINSETEIKNESFIIFEKFNNQISFTDIIFLSPSDILKDNVYQLITPEQKNYAYIIKGNIDKSILKSFETLLLPINTNSHSNLITGFTFSTGTGIVSIIGYLVFFIIIFSVIGVLVSKVVTNYSDSINIPIIAVNHKSNILKMLNKALMYIESGNLKEVELILTKVLDKYPCLTDSERIELDPVIKSAFDYVDIFHLKNNINQINKVINLQNNLNSFDEKLFSDSVSLLDNINKYYERLDSEFKSQYLNDIIQIQDNLSLIKEKYIKN